MGRKYDRPTRRSSKTLDTGLNAKAKAKLDECVAAFEQDLLTEAQRLEAGARDSKTSPEITSTMVSDANIYLRRYYRKPPRSLAVLIVELVTVVALIVVGVAINHLDEMWGLVMFVISFSVASVGTLVALVKEGR